MAKYYVLPLGFDADISLNQGDYLIVVYCGAAMRKLCYVSGDKNMFDQELPWGSSSDPKEREKGSPWPGPKQEATVFKAVGAVGSQVKYTSRGPNNNCSSTSNSTTNLMGSHSITISG